MKAKFVILFLLVILAGLPAEAPAAEHDFPAGSLIFPMDSFYQGYDDGGLLEVYGLIYYLLDHQDEDCLTECGSDENCREACEHDITVYWVINGDKTTIDGIDLVIEDTTLPRDEGNETIDTVVKLYDHAGGIADLAFDTARDDSFRRISYRGGIFIIDVHELDDEVVEAAKAMINSSRWSAVAVHQARVPFASPIYREMKGTPPKIALMNNGEDKTKGNAAILESYLRLAGICNDSYEVVTPYEIAGIAPDGSSMSSKLRTGGYDFVWAPHWDGTESYGGDLNHNGRSDMDDVIYEVQLFLKAGKGVLAECASIEGFEHSEYGRFLTDKSFGHNGGTNDEQEVIYNDVTAPNSQIGDRIGFGPVGGHLHNWRPYRENDPYNFDQNPDVSGGASVYNDTVTRFTIDDTNGNGVADDTDWDYYVGGYAYGNTDYGYLVYLGGHRYARCDQQLEVNPESNAHPIDFEFKRQISTEVFTLVVRYEWESNSSSTRVSFTKDGLPAGIAGSPLEIDLSAAAVNHKELLNVILRNRNASIPITITGLELSWTGGDNLDDQEIKGLTDQETDIDLLTNGSTYTFEPLDPGPPEVSARLIMAPVDFAIEADPASGAAAGCTDNSDCQWDNLPAVRYVLNTLFNIKYRISNNEYVRAAPIVSHPYLYQGSFEYPSYFGHFKRYDVTQESPRADWDTGDSGKIPDAAGGNFSGRKVYTARDNGDGSRSVIDFDEGNVDALKAALGVTPDNDDDTDEIRVIKRIRGQDYDYDTDSYVERYNKLGGIMHSAPVVVRSGGSRFNNRPEVAYVGDLNGMLHAINTQDGTEKWAYIPSNLLGKLKNDRTDPNAVEDFAAVDGSPTAMDIYYDPDYDPEGQDPENKQWHTILVGPQGFGGKSIFALDITDPDSWSLLWESTDTAAPGGGMGYAYRVSLGKVKVALEDEYGDPTGEYGIKWMVFVATSFAEIAENHGGISVFAFDLVSGDKLWAFSAPYADAVNDIPGAVSVYDIDDDTFVDRIYVGDMNGRLWELEALDGSNSHGIVQSGDHIGKQIPLFNAGVGNPISVSPAIIRRNGNVILIFGTGGANWASNDKAYHVYSVDSTAAGRLSQAEKSANYNSHGGAIDYNWALPLPVGQKVWSSPTIAAGLIWIAVSSGGTLESTDPKNDTDGGGELIQLDLDEGDRVWTEPLVIGDQVRGSLYVTRQHIYMTTIRGDITQVGGGAFDRGTANRVVLRAWKQAR